MLILISELAQQSATFNYWYTTVAAGGALFSRQITVTFALSFRVLFIIDLRPKLSPATTVHIVFAWDNGAPALQIPPAALPYNGCSAPFSFECDSHTICVCVCG